MPLFGFADIKFDKGSNAAARGPLRALQGTDFETTTLRYPIDVGNYDKSHYIVFYIREQQATKETLKRAKDVIPFAKVSGGAKVNSIGSGSTSFGSEIMNKINSGFGQINQITGGTFGGAIGEAASALGKVVGNVSGQIDNLFGGQNSTITGNAEASTQLIDNSIKRITGGSFGLLRKTTLTKDAIALYMPDTLQYTYSQSYDTPSIGGEIGATGIAAGISAMEQYAKGGTLDAAGAALKALAGPVAKSVAQGALGQTGSLLFTAATGTVSNPMLEMIYKSPNFRTFQFDFTFYPRDEKEAYEVQRIIERFRFHQAPQLAEAQNFLIPPSEFDIQFYYGGSENPNIPTIATCVLTTIDVNYAPNGFAAYEVPNENTPAIGRTGMPVAIQMNLQFQEVTYLTKDDFTGDNEFDARNKNAENEFRSQSGQLGT